jgi:hypothetical protein
MTNPVHSFLIEDAEKYGVECAIMLYNLRYWCEKNRANEKNFHDGYYWTYNSKRAFTVLFPYWTERQIRTILDKLRESGAIKVGNYNQNGYDRTLWYAVTDQAIGHKSPIKRTDKTNQTDGSVQPIPDNKPDINTDVNKEGAHSNECFPAYQFPLKKSNENYELTKDEYDNLKQKYPSLDIDTEFEKMIEWLETNPKRRKTASGMPRFITSWLRRAYSPPPWKTKPKNLTAEELIESVHERIEGW